ncbi:MAG: oxalate/formate MFS antiporter [Oxalicibacterium faecigallinarum]|uniref:Oxalate/formate MFS antiporter n=1 Tax=Oxalicibacterium faecigallinarum TaxID=573741 RepID=A0A8J3AT46_9BURK|nr:oxalate/formate MFS antiporter [Oxalicibacterium faecigallinarum]MDQ7968889.1 oxalate/formate MFS antiporter [Oxalicibacterium faecigallinarum]GGI21584.1 oxalate/formate MFS antiporter [Oxalicibacterium faecigallinarum]
MTQAANTPARSDGFRWGQLVFGIIAMAMIANLQYGWTLFVDPIAAKHGWSRAAIQVAFTIFVLTETWLVPIEGWFVDKFGPRPVVLVGGILCGLGWFINSFADTLAMLYFAAVISGIGAGAVYGTCVGNALKWFPDRRGLAAGLTAAGFGAGSAITILPISAMIANRGYEDAFLYFGIGQGIVVVIIALLLVRPPEHKKSEQVATVQQTKRDYSPSQVLKEPVFWIMYSMFVMVAAGGLMATAQLGSIARDFKVFDVEVSMMGLTLPALTFALAIDRVLNGLTRPFFGWVSDKIGREPTMFIAFAIEAVGILALFHYGHNPYAFVILTGIVFFAWGEIYSLFPSTCADTFGSKFASANAGLLYTAKGTASLLVPLSAVLATATGGWYSVFVLASILNAIAALMAWFVLKPMRAKHMSKPAVEATN